MGLMISLSRCRSGHQNLLSSDVVEKLLYSSSHSANAKRNPQNISDETLMK